jgi:hypothetical protein
MINMSLSTNPVVHEVPVFGSFKLTMTKLYELKCIKELLKYITFVINAIYCNIVISSQTTSTAVKSKQIKEDEVGGVCSMYGEKRTTYFFCKT